MEAISDISIIEGILNGNKKLFKNLYEKYVRLFMLTSLRYLSKKSDAEDVVQEAFIKIYKCLSQFDSEKGNFGSWSKRIVINTCLEHLRKKNVLHYFEEISDYKQLIKIPAAADASLNLQDLTKVISSLPKGYRNVFNMHVIDGFTHKEIAKKLNITESTSKTQLMKAKKYLRIDTHTGIIIELKNHG